MKEKSSGRREAPEDKRIAVIEEIADDIYSIKFILQSIGYEVTSFSSRKSYQDALDEFAPHLIVVDMMIPGGEAYGAMKELGTFAFDEDDRLIGVVEVPSGTLQDEELRVYIEALAKECDRFEYALKGWDRE